MKSRLVMILAAMALAGCSEAPAANVADRIAAQCSEPLKSDMVWIAGGSFMVGENPRYPEEYPPRQVDIGGFWISPHEVTNAQFAGFVKATGYTTMAERDPPKLPGAPPEMLQPGSAVFTAPTAQDQNWWRWAVGAQWRHPGGPDETIAGKPRDPVVQIAYQDAQAYADWAGMALPTEEQWEYAARGGTEAIAEPVDAEGKPQANYYQGVFPVKNTNTDGYLGRAPVGCFPPNAYGLYDMVGNVWEWTTTPGGRSDAREPVNVIKGGSYLCADNYCARYRPAARQFQERGLGTDHIGFRLVDNAKPAPSSRPKAPE